MKAENIYTTAEEIHATVESIVKALSTADPAKIHAPREIWKIYNIWEAAAKLRDDAAEEMRREANKQSGRATVAAAAMRILKDANAQPHEGLHGANRSADGCIDICDAYRLIRLNAATAPDLPERPANLPPYIDAANLYKVNARYNSDPVHLPEPAELRAFIKTEKARKKATKDKTPPIWTLTTDAGAVIWVNAIYLLDELEALPNPKAYAANHRAEISTIIFEADNGRGLLLPVRQPKQ